MKDHRQAEANVLGYDIERVTKFDERGDIAARWYEVTMPGDGALLGTFAQRSLAEREIVARELALWQRRTAA